MQAASARDLECFALADVAASHWRNVIHLGCSAELAGPDIHLERYGLRTTSWHGLSTRRSGPPREGQLFWGKRHIVARSQGCLGHDLKRERRPTLTEAVRRKHVNGA